MSKNISDKKSVNNSPTENETINDIIIKIAKLFYDNPFRDECLRILFEKSSLVKTEVGRFPAKNFLGKKILGKKIYEYLPLDTSPIGGAIYKYISKALTVIDFYSVIDEINTINSSNESVTDKKMIYSI